MKKIIQKITYKLNNNFNSFKNVNISKNVYFAHHVEIEESSIGKRTSIGRYTKIRNSKIGKYCSISWNVTIGAPTHPMDRLSTHAFSYRKQFRLIDEDIFFKQKETIIGNDVWIGCNAVIISGVKVGDGAVIGAGAIVTKDVDPYSVVAGVPAKEIRKRFDDNTIKKLTNIKWWDFDDNLMIDNIKFFQEKLNDDIIDKLSSIRGESNEKI